MIPVEGFVGGSGHADRLQPREALLKYADKKDDEK